MSINTRVIESEFGRQDLLSSSDAARLIGIAEITIKKSRRSGTLLGKPAPVFLKMGRVVRYEAGAIQQWLAQFQPFRTTDEASAGKFAEE